MSESPSTSQPLRRNRRHSAAQGGNIVPLRAPVETTADIVRDLQERSRRNKESLSMRMQELLAVTGQLHRERAEELVPIGFAMDRSMLDEFIEIGQRMLGSRGRRP